MLRFIHPEDRWPRALMYGEDIESAFRAWQTTECQHVEAGVRRKHIKGGNIQYVKVCVECGLQYGGPLSKKSIENADAVPDLNGLNDQDYYRDRRAVWLAQQLSFYEGQSAKGNRDYNSYLASPEWKQKRKTVLARANGICEACLQEKATQVHHLTYDHLFDELLWELVAVCDGCHRKAHPHHHDETIEDD